MANLIWYLIPLLILISFFKSRFFKGKLGESIVNFSIMRNLDKDTYHLLKDITLPTRGGTTQIDHVLVSVYGIFVIETKNLKGWIFGSKAQKKWTQQIYKHRNTFQNPLDQNYKHIKTLANLLNLDETKFHSIVIFTGKSNFKTSMPENVLDRGYTKYIKSKNNMLLSELEVQEIILRIESEQLKKGFRTDRNHVTNLKKKQQILEASENCPKCGSKLVKRVSGKGANAGKSFYGCSSYPKCKYTKNII